MGTGECMPSEAVAAEPRKPLDPDRLIQAFVWSETPQGHDHWEAVFWDLVRQKQLAATPTAATAG